MAFKYNISTLDPEKIISKMKFEEEKQAHYEPKFLLDFTMGNLDERRVVIATDEYEENALLRQLFFTMQEEDEKIERNEDLFLNQLFFLDFEKLFKYKKELKNDFNIKEFEEKIESGISCKELNVLNWHQKLYFLFKNGFYIQYDKEKELCHYVPFESSASMSRTCRITFINEKYKDLIDARLMLGMDLTLEKDSFIGPIEVKPHKYYAYRGLYMTDGHIIEQNDNLRLNEETVIVLPDAKYASKDDETISMIGAKEDNNRIGYWNIFTENGKYSINAFDGEGIICSEYASEINRQLYGLNKCEATSFQVRMPFIKGMLHTVDFNTFLEEECDITGESWMIEDCYHILRDIKKAKIILTESMLKNHEWLEEYVLKSDSYKEDYECDTWFREKNEKKKTKDPIKAYFVGMHKYNHALYIVRTDLNLHNTEKQIKLNYQSLNTLAMDNGIFRKKVGSYIEDIRRIESDPDYQREFVLGNKASNSGWKYALSRNIDFLSEKYIRNQIIEQIDSRIKDIYRGNIRVSGENRFLSGDLLAFMIHILKCSYFRKDDLITELIKFCLKTNEFKAPEPRVSLKEGKTYGFLRNPHLSRNEECILNYAKVHKYDKYFDRLSGVIMIAYVSFAPMTLGGADFDGDMVKLIADIDVIKAMKDGKKLCKELVNIPSSSESKVIVPQGIDYAHVKDTFGNQIGRVSNLAIRLGEQIYLGKLDTELEQDSELESDTHQYIPADCTLLTGLEIDSAKNGKHPKLNIEELSEQVGKNKTDYISVLGTLKEIEKYEEMKKKTKDSAKNSSEISQIYYKKWGSEKKLDIQPISEDMANIEMLPALYFDSMFCDRNSIKKRTEATLFRFDEEKWRKEDDKTYSEIKAIVDVYNLYNRRYWVLKREDKRLNDASWYGKAVVTLKEQYYGRADFEEKVHSLAVAYAFLEAFVVNLERKSDYGQTVIERCRCIEDKIREVNWIFTPINQRIEVLKLIIPPEEAAELYENIECIEILTNFKVSGQMILFYLIKTIQQTNTTISDRESDNPTKENFKMDKECYIDMYRRTFELLGDDYRKALRYKYSVTKLEQMMRKTICNKLIKEDIYQYASMIYLISSTFFWKLFDGRAELEYLKNSEIIIDYLPYKKWTKIQTVSELEQYEEEEGYIDVE